MKPLKSLLPAVDDTATRALVDVQTAITKVKEIITYNVSHGTGEKETTAQLNKAIAEECNRVSNVGLREQMRKSLVDAARAWHFLLKEQYRVLDNHLAKANQRQPLGIDIGALSAMTPYQKEIEFAKILDDGTAPGIPIIRDYRNSVKSALKALAAEPPKVVTRHDGATYVMPLRNRAEMAVRYDAHVKAVEGLQADGVDLAWTSSHPNCSPRCKDYQGRLWSMSGKSGNIDGIPYSPIDEALKGKKGDGNGIISGYNCRHRLIAYQKGSKPPQDFTEAEIKHEYSIDKQQRSYENRIRQMKTEERELRAAGFTKEASALRKKWRRLTVDYQLYSMENDRAYYPDRCTIDRAELGEETYLSIDNSEGSGIIKKEFVESPDIKAAETYAKHLGIKTAVYKGNDLETANSVNQSIYEMLERAPKLVERVKFIGTWQEGNKIIKQVMYGEHRQDLEARYPGRDNAWYDTWAKKFASKNAGKVSNAYAVSRQFKNDDLRGIYINSNYGNNSDEWQKGLRDDVASGWHPLGVDTIKAAIDHELTHQLDHMYDLSKNPDIQKIRKGLSADEVKQGLSRYANENIREFIAESYAEYINNPTPRDIASKVGKIIDGVLKNDRK